MKQEKEEKIVSARLWLDEEIGTLAGFAHEQYGYKGVLYSIKQLKRLAKVLKRDLQGSLKQ
jgi:hypothetical protein